MIIDNKNKFCQRLLRIIFIVFLSLFALISFFYVFFFQRITYDVLSKSITEIGEQSAIQLNLSINNQKKFVDIIVDSIQSGYFKTQEDIFKRFENDLVGYDFTRLAILDEIGNGKTSDGRVVKDYPNIKDFFKTDQTIITVNKPSVVSDYPVNIYSKTFTFQKKKYVLFATIRTEDYKELIYHQLFHGQGNTYLIQNDGTVLIDSCGSIQDNDINFYDYLKSKHGLDQAEEIQKMDDMATQIKNLENGTFAIKISSATYFMHYEKMDINHWYIVSVVPDSVLFDHFSFFFVFSFALYFVLDLLLCAVFLFIYRIIRKQNEKLYHIAYCDTITGLGNETYLKEKGTEFLKKQNKNQYAITLDINKFKAFNKIYDYEFCNKILKSLGEKLVCVLPSKSIIGRMSNDVFAILMEYELDLTKLISKIFEGASSLKVNDTVVSLSLSIGVYPIKEYDDNINVVLDKAYLARTQIKGIYDNNYFIFDDDLERQILDEQEIEASMQYALENFEFKVFYQPKVSCKTGKMVGAEALVRWYRNGELVTPEKFIPLFEKNKFIRKLDLYVFETVCKDMVNFQEQSGYIPNISVNISKEHFVDESFMDDYLTLIYQYGVDKSKIEFEITESATGDPKIDILELVANIKKNGFTVSIDDFGTGYSSLNMLQNLPVDVIKVDKTFVDNANLKIEKNILNYIVMIAEQLGVKTVIEGVETKEQLNYLKKIGCDVIQGYYYSKPLNKSDFEKYMKKQKKC